MMRELKRCKVPGCGRDHKAKGYCHKHYRDWKRTGAPITWYSHFIKEVDSHVHPIIGFIVKEMHTQKITLNKLSLSSHHNPKTLAAYAHGRYGKRINLNFIEDCLKTLGYELCIQPISSVNGQSPKVASSSISTDAKVE